MRSHWKFSCNAKHNLNRNPGVFILLHWEKNCCTYSPIPVVLSSHFPFPWVYDETPCEFSSIFHPHSPRNLRFLNSCVLSHLPFPKDPIIGFLPFPRVSRDPPKINVKRLLENARGHNGYIKVHIFWEGHRNLKEILLVPKKSGIFLKLCILLII